MVKSGIWMALGVLLFSCCGSGTGKNAPAPEGGTDAAAAQQKRMIARVTASAEGKYHQGEKAVFAVKLAGDEAVDSLVLWIDSRRVAAGENGAATWDIPATQRVGRHAYRMVAHRGGEESSYGGSVTVCAAKAPVETGVRVVKTYPHSTSAYTQGLVWHDGFLYEGTGQYGESVLRKVDPATGKSLQETRLEGKYFGEGIALLDNKIYQLTWQEGKAFVYDLGTLKRTGEFAYTGEGWGLTTDGRVLYMSDGTENIHLVDPATFERKGTIQVYTDQGRVLYINELEWIEGMIWANVYTTDRIVVIDPATGCVVQIADLAGLLAPEDVTSATDVLNGIAYDPATKRIFVTGKNWNKLFEIELLKKAK